MSASRYGSIADFFAGSAAAYAYCGFFPPEDPATLIVGSAVVCSLAVIAAVLSATKGRNR